MRSLLRVFCARRRDRNSEFGVRSSFGLRASVFGLALAATSALAQTPPNDFFTNATVITGLPGSTNGTAIGATNREAGDPSTCGWSDLEPTVWYSWTAPTNGPVTFVVQSTNYNLAIAVYTGTNITNLVQVACYGSIALSTNSSVSFNATNGVVYSVEVGVNDIQPSGFVPGGFNLSWFAGGSQSQPCAANDNFANATVITGVAGSIAGCNVGATLQFGEPANCGLPSGASIWYVWTNSTAGIVNFNTEGSDFDTTLGIYTGTSLDSLTSVACNDDVSLPTDLTSSVTFNANGGTVYYISVDGYGGSMGNVILNWSAGGVNGLNAGTFRFSSPTYIYGENEDVAARNVFMTNTITGRLTVTRTGGAVGRVQLGVTAASGTYTNYTVTSIYGTNVTQGTTNLSIASNVVQVLYVQNNDYGQYDYYQIVNYSTNGSPFMFNIGSNFPAPPLPAFCNTMLMSTDMPPVITNIYCTNYIVTNYVPAATFPGGSVLLSMDDFQMSQDLFAVAFPPAETNGVMVNGVFLASITNAVLDTNESQQVAPPVLGAAATTLVNVLNQRMIVGSLSFLRLRPDIFPPGFVSPTPLLDYNQPLFNNPTNVINFERATLRCTRTVNGQGVAHVGVIRTFGDAHSVTIPYRIDYYAPRKIDSGNNVFLAGGFPALQAGSDYAAPPNPGSFSTDTDYTNISGTITFPADDPNPVFIDIPIYRHPNQVEFNEDMAIELYYPDPRNPPAKTDWSLGYVNFCVLTILFDNINGDAQPAGAKDRLYNPDNDANTTPPYNLHPGANNVVYSLVIQPDGKTVCGGDFTAYNTVVRNRIVRANLDGSLDTTFDPADGFNQFVSALALDASGNILAGGFFTSFNGTPRSHIARLSSSGALDTSFFPGSGADGTVWSVGVQSSGAILIAGEFTTYNGTNRNYIARLNSDGSLDTSFDPRAGPNGTVQAVAVQPDGRVIIGGDFTTVDGQSRNHVARLNTDGSLDTTFAPGDGADDIVYDLALQPDGRVLAAGAFHTMEDVSRNSIARLNSDGSLDLSFDPGSGADDTVYSISLQSDGGVILGGLFTSFNQTRRVGLTRLFSDGSVDTSFMDTAYNQFAGLIRHYYNQATESKNFIFASALQPDGNLIIAGEFTRMGGGYWRDDVRFAHFVTRVIGNSTPGPGNITLATPSYFADLSGQQMFVSMFRTNGHLGPASATVSTVALQPGPGSAAPGVDYIPTSASAEWIVSWSAGPGPGTWQLQDGTFGQNQGFTPTVEPNFGLSYTANDVYVTILNNTNTLGNRSLNLVLSNPSAQDLFLLGGQGIPLGVALGRYQAPLTIVDSRTFPGTLSFSAPAYTVNEGNTNAIITVTRTNGSQGLVTVQYMTANGTATNGIHYRGVTNRLSFNPGETVKTFSVPIIDESIVDYNHTVLLSLFNATGGASLGQANAVLTIIDNDVPGGFVQFSSPTYGVNEDGGFALLTVTRNGSSAGTVSLQFATTNLSALAFTNYLPVATNLTWNNGDVLPKTVAIPILDDGIVEPSNLAVGLRLFSPTLNGSASPQTLGVYTNATLFITNRDFVGQLGFSTPVYNVNENGGFASITVVRTGGSSGLVSVNYATSDGSAVAGVNYAATSGTLAFGAGDVSKTFNVPVLDDKVQDPVPFYFTITLSNPNPAGSLGTQAVTTVSLLDAESFNQPPGGLDPSLDPLFGVNDAVHALGLQADGKLLAGGDFTMANGLPRNRLARWNADGSLDLKFSSGSPTAGANGSVLALLSQTDGRILVGGQFTTFNSIARNYLARLNIDGSIDSTFTPGSGPDNSVFTAVETFAGTNGTNRKLLIGGSFLNFASAQANYLARLNNDGSLDSTFTLTPGANGAVFAIAVQTDGKALIGGDFTTINGVPRNHIARLNTDGSVDLGFDPAAGPNDSVRAIAVQLDGRIVIGGLFTNVNGALLNHLARLNARGSVDGTFTPGVGANDVVTTISIQPDTRIVLGGQFTQFSGVTRGRITRLNNDGTADTMINFGSGANSFVGATVIQTDGLIVFGGGFTSYDGHPAQHLARIFGGTIAGSGNFEFDAANYQVTEDSSNAVVTVRRRNGTSGVVSNNVLIPNVSVTFATSDGTARSNANYTAVATNLVFPPGEVLQSVSIPIIHDFLITPDLTVNLGLSNPSPPLTNGPALGNQPVATLTIVNVDSAVSFSSSAYSAPENPPTGVALIPVIRSGSTIGSASVDFFTTTNGTAIAFTNYIPVTNTLSFAPGQGTNIVSIPMIHTPQAEGDTTVIMQLANAINTLLLSPSVSTLTIVDVDHAPGQFLFAQTNYVVSEGGGSVQLTVVRTNGHTGVVTVGFGTVAGTASPGLKYTTTSGVLSFQDGETSKTITVPILEENQVEGNTTFSVILSNATAGATISTPATATVTIIDDDVGVSFASPAYVVNETAGSLLLSLNRIGTNGVTTVNYATANGTALAGTNFVAASGTLTFNPGEALKTLSISILHDPRVTGNQTFTVNLSNPSPGAQLAFPSSATVIILDAEAGLSFTNSTLSVLENATNAVITVVCSNPNVEPLSVNYFTSDGTATAGLDYLPVSGTLSFTNGIVTNYFSVPIIDNLQINGDHTFNVALSSPTPPGVLVAPTNLVVTIINVNSGISFSSPNYSVLKNGVSATIGVLRTGYTNSLVSVNYATQDGTATNGADYLAVSGTLVFTNGQTATNFSVPVLDSTIIKPDLTVLLQLSNAAPAISTVLLPPSAATLTIQDHSGSKVVPAGSALISESGPVNGLIDPGETVSLLLALRDSAGTNSGNLVATLLATNGVIPQGQSTQTYGPLTVNGPSVSRPFSFIANGTNGQTIIATLKLQDGANTNLGTASFTYILGSGFASFTNNALILINDSPNPPTAASPYPSTLNVSGVGGSLIKMTVNFTNLNHTSPSDIDALLVSPGGQKVLLMAHCGGQNAAQMVNLTFDDAASSALPQFSQIVSGTNKPTAYLPVTTFPLPAPPGPYATNLTAFNTGNPNGVWSLYIMDDKYLDSGALTNGWSLNMTTASPVGGAADLVLTMSSAPAQAITGSNVTYTLTVTNYGPSPATGVNITDTLSANASFVSASGGGYTVNGNAITFTNLGSMATNGALTVTITARAGAVGSITNSATALANETDPYLADNTATAITPVVNPTADLSLTLADSPDPVLMGSPLTYTMTVSNFGPAGASGVKLTNTLPNTVRFVSASPGGYVTNGVLVVFTNISSLGVGGQFTATVVVTPLTPGLITDAASVGGPVTDPLKANNFASVKTIVEALQLSISHSGNSIIISWPADASGSVLQSANNLTPPIAWSTVSSPPPQIVGGQKIVTISTGPGTKFYRLAPGP